MEDDLNTQELETNQPSGGEPPVENQPVEDGGPGTSEAKPNIPETVPYSRFQEVNEEKKTLRETNEQLLAILRQNGPAAQTTAPATAPPVQDTGPDLLAMPGKDAFTKDVDGYPEYDESAHLAAIANTASENALRKLRHEQKVETTKTAQQRAADEQQQWINTGEAQHPGFLNKINTQIVPVLNQYAKPEFEEVTKFIKQSPQGYEVLVYLADNPAEIRRLAMLNPVAAMREVMTLEGKLKKPEPNRTTAAPNPIKPLAGSDTNVATLDDIKDDDEWYRQTRAREIKRKMGAVT